MGLLEAQSRKKRRNRNLQAAVLGTVAVAGVLSMALVAPNALQALQHLGIIPRKREPEYLRRTRDALIRKGFLEYQGKSLRITSAGEAHLRRLTLHEEKRRAPRRWDKRWRVLIFDFPEQKKGLREKVRRTLVTVGFARLQDSVWLYPYDCEDLVALLKADFRIGKEMLYLIVEALEYDRPWRRHFGLPST